MVMRCTSHSPKLQHFWSLTVRWFSVESRTLVGGSLTPLLRSSRCILQPQPTGLSRVMCRMQTWQSEHYLRSSNNSLSFSQFLSWSPYNSLGRQHLCWDIIVSLYHFDSSSDLQFFQSPFQAFGSRSKRTINNLVSLSLTCSTAFSVLWQGPGIWPSFRFLLFSLDSPSER